MIPHIAVEVNNSCNQNCIFCYNHRPHENFKREGNYKALLKVLKRIYTLADIGNITFTGGEPLLEPRLPELILFAKMKKSLSTVISNGTLFTPDRLREMLLVKNDLFQLPVHSYKSEVHDRMTGLNGSHEKSVKAIKELQSAGANVVAVIVLTGLNIKDIDKTIQFISELGIKQISVDRYNIGGTNKNKYSAILPEKQELRNAYTLINSASKRLNIKLSSNVCTPHCILNPADFPFIMFGNCPENPLHFPVTISVDGTVRVCNHSPVAAGNIFKEKFQDILKSDYVKSWNENIPDLCMDCSLWKNCRGGCRAASEQTVGNNKMADPVIRGIAGY